MPYTITISGTAKTDYSKPEELDGVDCQENFADYFSKDLSKIAEKRGIRSGYMHFSWEDGKLITVTEYEADEKLTQAELDKLVDYTTGQWSDGIGEGFEQEACRYSDDDEAAYISPWHSKQKVLATQRKHKE